MSKKRKNGIEISKIKTILHGIVFLGIFVAILIFLLNVVKMPNEFNKYFLIGCLGLLFVISGLGIMSSFKKLFLNKLGLEFNQEGLKINYGPNKGQFINWNEILQINIHYAHQGPCFVLITVKYPERILAKSFGLNNFLIKRNNKAHGTPVSIATNWLKGTSDKIFSQITGEVEKYKITVPNSK